MADTPQELERLQKLRTELENRLASIEDEHKTVEEDIKILKEKLAIQELEKKLKEKQDAVATLRVEKNELEDKMGGSSRLSMSEALLRAKVAIENNKDILETEKKEEEEPSRAILRKDERTLESTGKPEGQDKKKKLRIF